MIHRKKNRPALQRRDILTVSLVPFLLLLLFLFVCLIGNLLKSSSTQFLVVLFFTAPFSSEHLRVSVLSNLQGPFLIYLVDFSYSEGLFFSGIFHASCIVLFFFLVLSFLAGLHCLLRMHALNSSVCDT